MSLAHEVVCPTCGRTNRRGEGTCRGCGAPLYEFGAPRATSGERGASKSVRPTHQEPSVPPSHRVGGSDSELASPSATRSGSAPGEGPPPHKRAIRRRVRRTPIIVGSCLLAVGLLVIAGIYAINARPRTQYVPAQDTWVLSPTTLTAMTIFVTWSGGTPATKVYLVWGNVGCVAPTGVVGTGTGANGSLTASLDPGTTYSLFACSGPGAYSLNFTVSLRGGVTLADVVAGFIAGIGGLLVVTGLRGRKVPVFSTK